MKQWLHTDVADLVQSVVLLVNTQYGVVGLYYLKYEVQSDSIMI